MTILTAMTKYLNVSRQLRTAVVLGFLCIAVLSSCEKREIFHSIMPASVKLHSSDVVFRRGMSLTSHAVIAADAQGNYSHVGIVVDSAGKKMIVHAVPGEPDFDGDVDRVKMDVPEKFFSSEYASKGEVCRPTDETMAAKAAQTACDFIINGCCSTMISTTATRQRCTVRNSSSTLLSMPAPTSAKAGGTRSTYR